MLCKPPVRCLWRSIDCPLHISVVRRFAPTATITAPPPFSTIIDFVMERMIHSYMRFRCLVDAIHVFLKLLSMIVPIEIVMRYKQIGVDHLVLDRMSVLASTLLAKCSLYLIVAAEKARAGTGWSRSGALSFYKCQRRGSFSCSTSHRWISSYHRKRQYWTATMNRTAQAYGKENMDIRCGV